MILTITGAILIIFGSLVSIAFWIPRIFDRTRMKEVMGRRYPLVYVVYAANGPILVLFGILMLIWTRSQ